MARSRIVSVSSVPSIGRREFALGALGIAGALGLGACSREKTEGVRNGYSAFAHRSSPIHQPEYASYAANQDKVCAPTEDNIEGPFYKSGAPRRATLVDDKTEGTRLDFTGHLLSASCAPLVGGLIEIWQADHRGAYDNDGFGLRGTVAVAEDGGFHISTIVPGHYKNGDAYRPAHLHLKLHAPGHNSLTTQLYFAGDPYNDKDPFIRESLIVPVERDLSNWSIQRDLVIATA